jgi:tRNA threonylcarbamoyladenosine biosynthesis protein TsaB
MLLLAIDTAGSACAAALARLDEGEPKLVAALGEEIGRGHSERLLPVVEAVLGAAGVGYADLGRIAVTIGPGSFVGVRVGVAAARALALALEIPAIGVGSLDALALAAAEGRSEGAAVAVVDARRGEVYALAQDIASGATLVEAEVIGAADFAMQLRKAPRPLIFNGSAAPAIAAMLAGEETITVGTADHPRIADVLRLACHAQPRRPPRPLYLRSADAKPQAGAAVARL